MSGRRCQPILFPMNYPQFHKEGCRFRVWAPEKETMILRLSTGSEIPMTKDEWGYFFVDVPGVVAGTRYGYLVDGQRYPDPCSSFQPEGVYADSEVVDHAGFEWRDSGWRGRP